MARGENSKNGSQATGELNLAVDKYITLAWDKPPLCLLNPQQIRFQNQAETCRYTLGGKDKVNRISPPQLH